MKKRFNQNGFTLIEVLIAMAISTIILAAAGTAFFRMQSTSSNIDQRSNMSVNARGAMYIIEENIRLLGFNPEGDLSNNDIMVAARSGFLSFNRNGLGDPLDDDEDELISIGLNATDDADRDGFANNGGTSLVIATNNVGGNAADDIAALRFAYAYDDDGDGNVELSANNFIRWAFDSNDDGRLDRFLDTDDDGDIDADDTAGGSNMPQAIDIKYIKAVKVWLVARTQNQLRGSEGQRTMVVGGQRFTPNGDFAHTLYTTTIRCRNKI